MVATPKGQLVLEQAYLDTLYRRLDELRQQARQRLDQVRRDGPSGSPQNRSERDAFASLHADRLAQLDSVEERLCFGRIDHQDGTKQRIGRIGLTSSNQTPILIDWRAPAAVPFYQATAAHRLGLTSRRHITTRGRTVIGLEDELFDLQTASDQGVQLSGEGALLAALAASRTGRMSDIVSTIQAEQDRVIRADLAGALVVQGGPGTGKTAVALHRAAYLMYTHRDRLAKSGVLLIGPSRTFLDYVDHVLPALGETGVVDLTIGSLIPGLSTQTREQPAVAALKGRLVMAKIIRRAVRNRQRRPAADKTVSIRGQHITITVSDILAAQALARSSHKPYNAARAVFVEEMIRRLVTQLAAAKHPKQPTPTQSNTEDWAELTHDIRSNRTVRITLNLCWMPLSPQQLVAELYAQPHLLQAAASQLSPAERKLLARPVSEPWTVSDVPILDEAAELLGDDEQADQARRRQAERARQREVAYAAAVLASQGNVIVKAEQLAERWMGHTPQLSTAEQAANDRRWTYGHVVVDEAQELTAMDWRALLRRCPTRSFTIVGDVGQTHASGGAAAWQQTLDPVFGQNGWHETPLTINYRTPRSIMDAAETRAKAAGVHITPTRSARDLPNAYAEIFCQPDQLVNRTLQQVAELVGWPTSQQSGRSTSPVNAANNTPDFSAGRLAVIAPEELIESIRQAVERSPLAELATGASLLDSPLVVLTPVEVKGLEFDDVVVVAPARITASASGPRDLYVAMTRPTQRLRLLVEQTN
ncbi:MAG: ATP-dependent DNA helicase [Bifidobacteriaceae bacterium]|nr:ATP-dependent DNA helicase [Bifidobacteriaceae bacterium]